jgi:hypothetical protein
MIEYAKVGVGSLRSFRTLKRRISGWTRERGRPLTLMRPEPACREFVSKSVLALIGEACRDEFFFKGSRHVRLPIDFFLFCAVPPLEYIAFSVPSLSPAAFFPSSEPCLGWPSFHLPPLASWLFPCGRTCISCGCSKAGERGEPTLQWATAVAVFFLPKH